jgi:hypothetical protein
MILRPLFATLAASALLLVASAAAAQPTGQPPAGQQPAGQQPGGARRRANVIELNEITITGRVQKPVAAVDISRLAPKLSLTELRQPFLDQVEQALYRDPF